MINKIFGNSYETAQKKNLKTNCSKPSFGMAYHLDSSTWNKTFDKLNEQTFISKIFEKIKIGDFSYAGKDGLYYKFKTSNGEFFYGRETKGMMSNLKFVPNNSKDTGFYIINNDSNPQASLEYKRLSTLLDSFISKKTSNKNTYNPQDIMPSNMFNSTITPKKNEVYQSMYLRDTTPRGLRGVMLDEKAARADKSQVTWDFPKSRAKVSDVFSAYA